MSLIQKTNYKYCYRYYLINSAGDVIQHRSYNYNDPHNLLIALMQSYRVLELKILGDLALVRRSNPTYNLNIRKINQDLVAARRLINELCHDIHIPANLTKNRTILNFVPDKTCIPMREVFMEIMVAYYPNRDQTDKSGKKPEKSDLIQANFTPFQYRFINKYFKQLPRLPRVDNLL